MASREFIQAELVRLEHNFGKERFKVTQQMFDLWSEIFADYEEEGVKVSVDEYLRTSEYPPTIASIIKIYKAKDEYRKELLSYLKGRYIWVCRWIEDKPTKETFSQFCKYAMSFPQKERKARVEEVISKAINYYNETQENKPFKDWLEE